MFDKHVLLPKWRWVYDLGSHIWTWDSDDELAYLSERASAANLIVEIGTYMGRSAKTMLLASPRAHLWCIDPFMVDGTRKCTEYFLRDEINQGRCEIIPKYTQDGCAQLGPFDGTIDMVFIDDGHSFDDVTRDIGCSMPLLRSGGIMCGHDYESKEVGLRDNDVARAVKKSLPDYRWPGLGHIWEWQKP